MQAARQVVRRVAAAPKKPQQVRNMSGSLSQAEEEKQMNLWRAITIVAVPACLALSVYKLNNPEHHHHESVVYPYMHIRAKEFPWGDCALFDMECWHAKKES